MLPSALRLHRAFGALLLSTLALASAAGQEPASTSSGDDAAATLARLTTLRDAFIARVHTAGRSCPIAPPTIVVTHIPSFGNYSAEKNTLYTADWGKLDPEEKALFVRLAGPNTDQTAARTTFENIAHRWVFVHELGHWWQACNQVDAATGRPPYALEYEANRIAMAYWREVDPGLTERMRASGQAVLDHVSDPTPSGQAVETYFNSNYQQLGPTPAYRWYQAHMIVAVFGETPPPSFAQSLDVAKH